jgi:hypothetical protein
MTCPMCGNEVPDIVSYTLQFPGMESDMTVCGKCYVLVSILDELKEIKDKLNG